VASAEPGHWTTYTYDNRGRLLTAVAPDTATVRQAYRGREAQTFDAKGTESVVVERMDGRIGVRKEDDPESSLWLQTRFDYGPFGVARKVTAADNTVQTIEHDRLGRVTRHTDPSTGTTTARYNAFGEPIEQVNGAGERTVTQYDLLGRATRVNSPDGSTTNTWDTAPLGKGRLQRSVSPDGVQLSYTYNDKGQTTSEKWVMENVTYQVNLDYDGLGRLGSVTYPDIPGPEPRFKVNYGYKPNGYLAQVTDAATSALYWRVDERDEAGLLTKQTYGNLTSESRTYDAIGLLDTITTFAPGGQQTGFVVHGYDFNRNLFLVEEDMVFGAVRHDFLYDSLNRLTGWQFRTYDGASHTSTRPTRSARPRRPPVMGAVGRTDTHQSPPATSRPARV
jgi:YD repeat-containing protein